MNFSEWLIDEARRGHKPHPDQRTLFDRGDFVPPKKALVKKKISSVAHTDIDRWLKSVDGLAKDLSALKDAKDKAKGKMDKIGKPKPEEQLDKPKEKDERNAVKRPRPEADRVLSPRSKPDTKEKPPESKSKPDRQFRMRRPDAEDSTDVKRVIEDRPTPRKSKSIKKVEDEDT